MSVRTRIRGIPWELAEDGTEGTAPGFVRYTAERVSRIAHANLQRRPVPDPVLDTDIDYQRDPSGCDLPVTWWTAERNGVADCKTLSGMRLAAIYARTGRWPVAQVVRSGLDRTVHVRLRDSDPSKELERLGRYRSGRRPWGSECAVAVPYRTGLDGDTVPMYEAGQSLPMHKRLDLLHPQLQRGYEAAVDAGLPIYLVSGKRPTERQIMLWEDRMRIDREAGRRAPRSWADVENHWARWWNWTDATERGVGKNGPPLLLPATSKHQRGEAMDLGVRGARTQRERLAVLDEAERVGGKYMRRPLKNEPWHYAARV